MSNQNQPDPACPRCGKTNPALILYGYPDFDDELQQELAEGSVILGGCCVRYPDPKYQCRSCGKEFGGTPKLIENGTPVDLIPEITEICYQSGNKEVVLRREYGCCRRTVKTDYAVTNEDKKPIGFYRDLLDTLFNRLYLNDWENAPADQEKAALTYRCNQNGHSFQKTIACNESQAERLDTILL